jgi:hypothetical protein
MHPDTISEALQQVSVKKKKKKKRLAVRSSRDLRLANS